MALEWSGQEEFCSQKLREWTVAGVKAGATRSAKNGLFTFATIDGAGHMACVSAVSCLRIFAWTNPFFKAPYNNTKEALTIVQRWVMGEPF